MSETHLIHKDKILQLIDTQSNHEISRIETTKAGHVQITVTPK